MKMRIVSLVPSVTETLFELGLDDQIAAITRYCTKPADRVKTKQRIGGTKNPLVEEILALHPDVVIVDMEENRKEDAEALRAKGIPLKVVFPKTMADAADMVERMGQEFGAGARAHEISNEIRERMAAFRPPSTVRALTLIWKNPYMTVNADTYVSDVAQFFGFLNVFANVAERYPHLNDEQIRACGADVALLPDEPYPFRPGDVKAFRVQFPEIPETILFDGSLFTWHGYGTLRSLRELPSILHP